MAKQKEGSKNTTVCKEQQAPLIQTMPKGKTPKASFEYKQVTANTSGGKGKNK